MAKKLNKHWKLKLLIIINRAGVESQDRMDHLVRNGGTRQQLAEEGLKLMAFGKCFSRLYKQYSVLAHEN